MRTGSGSGARFLPSLVSLCGAATSRFPRVTASRAERGAAISCSVARITLTASFPRSQGMAAGDAHLRNDRDHIGASSAALATFESL